MSILCIWNILGEKSWRLVVSWLRSHCLEIRERIAAWPQGSHHTLVHTLSTQAIPSHMSTVLPRSLPVWWGSAFPLHHSLLPCTERLKAQEEGVCPLVTLCCTHALNELSVRCFTTVLASTCCGLAGPALHLLLMCPLELVSLAAFKINLFISSRT